MDRIRVSRIQVKNLFGNINYDIKIPENSNVSIITAPNGRGKTTILNLVSFVLSPNEDSFYALQTIPFDEFRCTLSNEKVIELKQKQKETKLVRTNNDTLSRSMREQIELRGRIFFESVNFIFSVYNNNLDKPVSSIDFSQIFNDVSRSGIKELLSDNDGDEELYRLYRNSIMHGSRISFYLLFIFKKLEELLEDNNCKLPINFIKANRIQPVSIPPRRMRDADEIPQKSPLESASEDISNRIKVATDIYNESVSQAKDRLPQMFIAGDNIKLSYKEFMKGWTTYREELVQFQKIGIITPTKDFTMGKDISKVYEDKGLFLSTYLSAFKDTTAPLKEIYKRLSLFKDILDERNAITGKKVVFDREGVCLLASNRKLNLDALSSGEKHDFIMFYNLIFNIGNNGLVLVDEPEISLHIEWQETYLDKLLTICEMNGLQAIVATHSPSIISNHYDLLVDKGDNDGED